MSTPPCEEHLVAAETCIASEPEGECTCVPKPFQDEFSNQLEGSFSRTLAFYSPDEPEFCDAANDNVCEFLEFNASCCCQAEMTSYTACLYATVLTEKFSLTSSCRNSCRFGGDREKGSGAEGILNDRKVVVLGLVATVIGLILSIFYYCFCSRRRKVVTRTIQKEANGNDTGNILINVNCSSNQEHHAEQKYHTNVSDGGGSIIGSFIGFGSGRRGTAHGRRTIKGDESRIDESVRSCDTDELFLGLSEKTNNTDDLFVEHNDDEDIEHGRSKKKKPEEKDEATDLTEKSSSHSSQDEQKQHDSKNRKGRKYRDTEEEESDEERRIKKMERRKRRSNKEERGSRRKEKKRQSYTSDEDSSSSEGEPRSRRKHHHRDRRSEGSGSDSSSSRSTSRKNIDRREKYMNRKGSQRSQGSTRSLDELRKKRRSIESWYEKEKRNSKRDVHQTNDKEGPASTSISSISHDIVDQGTTRKGSSYRKNKRDKKESQFVRDISLPDKVEYSIRKARTLMDDADQKTTVRDQQKRTTLEEVRVAIYKDINKLMKVLEEDRKKMEKRIKKAQEEAFRLRMENETSARQINSLEESKIAKETQLLNAKTNVRIVRTSSSDALANQELENKSMSDQIDAIRLEKQQMAIMLARLAETKSQLEAQLMMTEVVNRKLQSDVERSGKKVLDIEMENSDIQRKVSNVNSELQMQQVQSQKLASSWDTETDAGESGLRRPTKFTATTLGTIPSQVSIDSVQEEEDTRGEIAKLTMQKRHLDRRFDAERHEQKSLQHPGLQLANEACKESTNAQQSSWLDFDFDPQRGGDDNESTFGFISINSRGANSAKKPLKRIVHE